MSESDANLKNVQIDLRNYPHFYRPGDGRNVPGIREIFLGMMEREVSVGVLSACHPLPEVIDDRFEQYAMEAKKLWPKDVNLDQAGRSMEIILGGDNFAERKLTLLKSQVVRTDYNGMPADINVLGVGKNLEPGRDLKETAEEARELGGVSLLCHTGGKCGIGVGDAREMVRDEYFEVDGIEIEAISRPADSERLRRELSDNGIKGVAVTGGHSYNFTNTSYCTFRIDLSRDEFDFEGLRSSIRNNCFEPHYGQVSLWQRFLTRDQHILRSVAGHLVGRSLRRVGFLKAVGLMKGKR